MARFEILDSTTAPLGEGPAAGDVLFELGMMYSVGRDVPIDLVSAHKWFNLAAVKGNREAVRLRREIADQMSESEIAAAQRAARDWLKAGAAAPAAALAARSFHARSFRNCCRSRGRRERARSRDATAEERYARFH